MSKSNKLSKLPKLSNLQEFLINHIIPNFIHEFLPTDFIYKQAKKLKKEIEKNYTCRYDIRLIITDQIFEFMKIDSHCDNVSQQIIDSISEETIQDLMNAYQADTGIKLESKEDEEEKSYKELDKLTAPDTLCIYDKGKDKYITFDITRKNLSELIEDKFISFSSQEKNELVSVTIRIKENVHEIEVYDTIAPAKQIIKLSKIPDKWSVLYKILPLENRD